MTGPGVFLDRSRVCSLGMNLATRVSFVGARPVAGMAETGNKD